MHVEHIGEEVAIPDPDDCDGCSGTNALLFKAKSVGSDAIRGRVRARSENWNDPADDLEEFIIHIK